MSRGEVVQKNHEVLQKPQSYICPIFLFVCVVGGGATGQGTCGVRQTSDSC